MLSRCAASLRALWQDCGLFQACATCAAWFALFSGVARPVRPKYTSGAVADISRRNRVRHVPRRSGRPVCELICDSANDRGDTHVVAARHRYRTQQTVSDPDTVLSSGPSQPGRSFGANAQRHPRWRTAPHRERSSAAYSTGVVHFVVSCRIFLRSLHSP